MADRGTSDRTAGKRPPKAAPTAKTSAQGARSDISVEDELWELQSGEVEVKEAVA
jgi:hypothetical protein